MKLEVLKTAQDERWYSEGLNFTCTACGNCCTGGPGFVWVTREEIRRLAEHLQITPDEVVEQYCRKYGNRLSFKETIRDTKWHDCVFLKPHKVSKTMSDGSEIELTSMRCSIYSVRPLQCRTWPFWKENVESQESWDHAAKKCHGMNHGKRSFTAEQIDALRDAKDWPENPPTSSERGRGKKEAE